MAGRSVAALAAAEAAEAPRRPGRRRTQGRPRGRAAGGGHRQGLLEGRTVRRCGRRECRARWVVDADCNRRTNVRRARCKAPRQTLPGLILACTGRVGESRAIDRTGGRQVATGIVVAPRLAHSGQHGPDALAQPHRPAGAHRRRRRRAGIAAGAFAAQAQCARRAGRLHRPQPALPLRQQGVPRLARQARRRSARPRSHRGPRPRRLPALPRLHRRRAGRRAHELTSGSSSPPAARRSGSASTTTRTAARRATSAASSSPTATSIT